MRPYKSQGFDLKQQCDNHRLLVCNSTTIILYISRPIPEPGTSRWGPTSHKVSTWNSNVTPTVFWCVTPCRLRNILHFGKNYRFHPQERMICECIPISFLNVLSNKHTLYVSSMKHDVRWTATVVQACYLCSLPYASECTRSAAVHVRTYKHEAAALSVLSQSVFWFIVKMSLRCWNVLKEVPGLKNT
jgi:hypothetical protein